MGEGSPRTEDGLMLEDAGGAAVFQPVLDIRVAHLANGHGRCRRHQISCAEGRRQRGRIVRTRRSWCDNRSTEGSGLDEFRHGPIAVCRRIRRAVIPPRSLATAYSVGDRLPRLWSQIVVIDVKLRTLWQAFNGSVTYRYASQRVSEAFRIAGSRARCRVVEERSNILYLTQLRGVLRRFTDDLVLRLVKAVGLQNRDNLRNNRYRANSCASKCTSNSVFFRHSLPRSRQHLLFCIHPRREFLV